jgi:hypothetical protein
MRARLLGQARLRAPAAAWTCRRNDGQIGAGAIRLAAEVTRLQRQAPPRCECGRCNNQTDPLFMARSLTADPLTSHAVTGSSLVDFEILANEAYRGLSPGRT